MSRNKNTLYFSKYAEKKFEVLNKHKVYYTHELIEDVVNSPDIINAISNYKTAQKEGVKVVYKEEVGILIIVTFYPVKP